MHSWTVRDASGTPAGTPVSAPPRDPWIAPTPHRTHWEELRKALTNRKGRLVVVNIQKKNSRRKKQPYPNPGISPVIYYSMTMDPRTGTREY